MNKRIKLMIIAAVATFVGLVGVTHWQAVGRGVEWTVSTVTFKHVTLYGEPFHHARNGGFVSYDGWGHCFGFEWYGTPGFFHGCAD